jgi:hypothetical protein
MKQTLEHTKPHHTHEVPLHVINVGAWCAVKCLIKAMQILQPFFRQLTNKETLYEHFNRFLQLSIPCKA